MENYRSFKQWFKCPPNAWVSSSLPVRGARLHEETPTRFMNEAELPTPGSTQPTEAGSPAAPAPAQGCGIQVLPSLGSPRLHHSPTRHPHCHQHQGTQGSMEYMGTHMQSPAWAPSPELCSCPQPPSSSSAPGSTCQSTASVAPRPDSSSRAAEDSSSSPETDSCLGPQGLAASQTGASSKYRLSSGFLNPPLLPALSFPPSIGPHPLCTSLPSLPFPLHRGKWLFLARNKECQQQFPKEAHSCFSSFPTLCTPGLNPEPLLPRCHCVAVCSQALWLPPGHWEECFTGFCTSIEVHGGECRTPSPTPKGGPQVTLWAEISLLPLCEAPVQSWSDGEQPAPEESRNSKVQRYQKELSAARSGDAKPPATQQHH